MLREDRVAFALQRVDERAERRDGAAIAADGARQVDSHLHPRGFARILASRRAEAAAGAVAQVACLLLPRCPRDRDEQPLGETIAALHLDRRLREIEDLDLHFIPGSA